MRRAIADGVPGWENTVRNVGCERISVAGATAHREVEGRSIPVREDDVRRVLTSPFAMISSDGVPRPGLPHPRWAGTFPKVSGTTPGTRGR